MPESGQPQLSFFNGAFHQRSAATALPRVLYSLHIDDEEPISCVVRIRDNGADMVLIRSRHDTPWRMRINSSYPEDVVWKVGMGMLAGFSPQWSMKLIVLGMELLRLSRS